MVPSWVFVHFRAGLTAAGIYRIEQVTGDTFMAINTRGEQYAFAFSQIQDLGQRECVFFRGPVAQLLEIVFLGIKPFYESSLMYRSELRRRLERVVPSRLWVE